jgi:predicted dienelactone hydrolase
MNEVLISRRRLFVGLGLGVAAATLGAPRWSWAQAAEDTPADTWRDLDWVDDSRQRPVPVRLYLPAQAAAAAPPAPLVVFSHGIGGSRRGYSYLGRHFAQHGVASLHLQHVGSDHSLWGGSVFGLAGRLAAAAQDAASFRSKMLRWSYPRSDSTPSMKMTRLGS